MEVTPAGSRPSYVYECREARCFHVIEGQTAMRKTIILAIATTFLAGASVVTGLAQTVHTPTGTAISAPPVVVPLATGSLTVSVFPST
jgi:hypothetical protein